MKDIGNVLLLVSCLLIEWRPNESVLASVAGSRIDKSWFMIRDTSLKTERLLSVVPLSSGSSGTHHGCDISSSDADTTRTALVDLFTALQHPYIYPILDVDFVYGMTASTYDDSARPALISVFPFNSKGSLKDLIYRVSGDHSNVVVVRLAKVLFNGLPLVMAVVKQLHRSVCVSTYLSANWIESMAGWLGPQVSPTIRRPAAAASSTTWSTNPRGFALPPGKRFPAVRPPSFRQHHHPERSSQVLSIHFGPSDFSDY